MAMIVYIYIFVNHHEGRVHHMQDVFKDDHNDAGGYDNKDKTQ